MVKTIAVIGAGNGGKAAAGDLALKGYSVRLFDFPEFQQNLKSIKLTHKISLTGAIEGIGELEMVTTDLSKAINGADLIMICTQALAHDRLAREMAPLVKPHQSIVINGGSSGGSLLFAHIFRQIGLKELPLLVETSTLTYACRGKDNRVHIFLKVGRIVYCSLPSTSLDQIAPTLEKIYPGLVRGRSVLEASLNNGNPVIHPAIAILNTARIEQEGSKMHFYKDGVSKAVARLIAAVDSERMALLKALGYPAQSDPVTSVMQGYAESPDYFECYSNGSGYIEIPAPESLDHRYLHEDVGIGLVFFCSLGELLGVPMPNSKALVRIASTLTGIDYFQLARRTVESVGIAGLTLSQLKEYMRTGQYPALPG